MSPAPAAKKAVSAAAEGQQAPDFALPGSGGETIALSALKGKKVVLYFYPKDDTPGCTVEAKDFATMADQFKAAGAVVVGMSKDSVQSHDKFKQKYCLPFPLASDTTGEVCERYGVWVEKSMYGKSYMGIERSTFLIDKTGVIRKAWRKVKVEGHVQEVLEEVKKI